MLILECYKPLPFRNTPHNTCFTVMMFSSETTGAPLNALGVIAWFVTTPICCCRVWSERLEEKRISCAAIRENHAGQVRYMCLNYDTRGSQVLPFPPPATQPEALKAGDGSTGCLDRVLLCHAVGTLFMVLCAPFVSVCLALLCAPRLLIRRSPELWL